MTRHVAVLMGGWSSEREISLVSGLAVSVALKELGYKVTSIDIQRNIRSLLVELDPKPDVIFNALHGTYGEDGCIQGLLNIMDIPYTHSGVLASSLAMNKPMAKVIMSSVGINVAPHKIINREEFLASNFMERPFVIKPFNEGSSIGIYIINDDDIFEPSNDTWVFADCAMVEKFIPGRELTVTVMGARPLAVTEITTGCNFYDYHAKYVDGGSDHIIPANVSKTIYDEALRISLLAHKSLGCSGISRADIRYDGKDLYMLEINTQPGMTPTSLVPEQAAYLNISFNELVSWLVENASCDG
jgi:D-alanine-D-alanine ligase